jgi:hypothetical protein
MRVASKPNPRLLTLYQLPILLLAQFRCLPGAGSLVILTLGNPTTNHCDNDFQLLGRPFLDRGSATEQTTNLPLFPLTKSDLHRVWSTATTLNAPVLVSTLKMRARTLSIRRQRCKQVFRRPAADNEQRLYAHLFDLGVPLDVLQCLW